MGPLERNVTLITLHIITYITGREWVTLRTESGIGAVGLPQKMVEHAPWSLHPLDLDVDGAPSVLETRAQQLGDRVGEIEFPAVSEVQARPHAGILA